MRSKWSRMMLIRLQVHDGFLMQFFVSLFYFWKCSVLLITYCLSGNGASKTHFISWYKWSLIVCPVHCCGSNAELNSNSTGCWIGRLANIICVSRSVCAYYCFLLTHFAVFAKEDCVAFFCLIVALSNKWLVCIKMMLPIMHVICKLFLQ